LRREEMPNFGKSVVWSGMVAATLTLATAVHAQAAGGQDAAVAAMAACNVDENTPSSVAKAVIFWTDSYNASGDSLKALDLQHAGKALTDPQDKNNSNLSGKAWEMGRVGVSWLALDSQKVVTTRGQLGLLGGDAAQKIDLSVVVDSSFRIVDSLLPKCVPIVNMYREGNGWYRLLNLALAQNNDAGNLPPNDTTGVRVTYDSATATINQASRISTRSPYIGLVRGQIDQWKNDMKAAVADYQDAILQTHQASNDTLYDPVRREIYEALGKMTLDAADVTRDTTLRNYYLKVAKETFTSLAKEPGTSGGKIAADGLTAVAIQTGDTASIKASYLSTLTNPDASYLDLVKAGFAANTAAAAGLKDATFDEIKLFRKAGEVNPWGRDWLYNLAIILAKADSGMAARPLIDRLLIVDPAGVNPHGDVYQAAQGVYALVQHHANDLAKQYADSANQFSKPTDAVKHKAYTDRMAVWEDSAGVFAKKSTDFLFKKDSIYVGVEVTGWVAKDGSVQMGGTLTNRSAEAKNVMMHVEFLDHDGKTVSSADVPATALDPKASKDFTLTGTGAGILAFKYTLQY
jgi:hypothetical protein